MLATFRVALSTLHGLGAAASPDFDEHAPATALDFFDAVSGGAHGGLIVFPASPEVLVGLDRDTACVTARCHCVPPLAR
jgi:hypothetical protein